MTKPSTDDRVDTLEKELDRLKFELSRTLNIDLSGKTPDANIPPQPERRVTDLGRRQLEPVEAPPASFATQKGDDSTGKPAEFPPMETGVLPGTSEPIVDSGGGQGSGVIVEQPADTTAAPKKSTTTQTKRTSSSRRSTAKR